MNVAGFEGILMWFLIRFGGVVGVLKRTGRFED
jgi:uncharacterized ion transporter superfamily protein YfcC